MRRKQYFPGEIEKTQDSKNTFFFHAFNDYSQVLAIYWLLDMLGSVGCHARSHGLSNNVSTLRFHEKNLPNSYQLVCDVITHDDKACLSSGIKICFVSLLFDLRQIFGMTPKSEPSISRGFS